MSSLDLKTEGPTDTLTDKILHPLRNFLQPDTALTLESTAKAVLAILPEKAPYSPEVWSFGEVCIELAEHIPYHHPSQLKLAALMEYLGKSTKLEYEYRTISQVPASGRVPQGVVEWARPRDQSEYINFHAFAANLHERRIFPTNPTWAIWARRDAHETPREGQASLQDAYVLAAAQWILWYGQSFFKQVLFPGDVSSDNLKLWRPGPLYDGKASLSLQRWHSWRDGFNAAASVDRSEGKGLGQECKIVAAKVAEMMDSLEKHMTF